MLCTQVDHTSAVDVSKTSGRSVDTSSGKHNCQHSKSARREVAEQLAAFVISWQRREGNSGESVLCCY